MDLTVASSIRVEQFISRVNGQAKALSGGGNVLVVSILWKVVGIDPVDIGVFCRC
jgi:hypothetical protein